jgi:hypothetical protein
MIGELSESLLRTSLIMKLWRTVKIVVISVVGFCATGVATALGLSLLYDNTIVALVGCAADKSNSLEDPFEIHWPWGCEHIIYSFRLNAEEVDFLNSVAGARIAAEIPDKAKAERLLKFFLSKGVDINASSKLSPGWTALRTAATSPDLSTENRLQTVQLLLKYGAKADVLDRNGRTALDAVRVMKEKYPDLDYSQVIKLLEAVAPPNIEATPEPEGSSVH